jgi:hypothetical protein
VQGSTVTLDVMFRSSVIEDASPPEVSVWNE